MAQFLMIFQRSSRVVVSCHVRTRRASSTGFDIMSCVGGVKKSSMQK